MGSGGLLELLMPQAPVELRAAMPATAIGGTAFDEVLTQAIGLAAELPSNEVANAVVLSLCSAQQRATADVSVVESVEVEDHFTGNPLPLIDATDGAVVPLPGVDESPAELADSNTDLVASPILQPLPVLPSAVPAVELDATTTSRVPASTSTLPQQQPVDATHRMAIPQSATAVSWDAPDALPVNEQRLVSAHVDRPQESSAVTTASGSSRSTSVLDAVAVPPAPTRFPGRPTPATSPERAAEPTTGDSTSGADRPIEHAQGAVRHSPGPAAVVVAMPAAIPAQRASEPGRSTLDRANPTTVRTASTNDSTAVRADALLVPASAPQLVPTETTVDSRALRTIARQSSTEATVGGGEPITDGRSAHTALPRELRELGAAMAPAPDLARRHGELMTQTLAERAVMLRAAGQSAATVTLEPESLGRVDVHVRMEADKTHINFTAQHSAVRDVIEANLPRLRLMLEDAGLSLGDVNVGHSDGGAGQDRLVSQDWRRPDDPTRALANDLDSAQSPLRNDRLIDVHV